MAVSSAIMMGMGSGPGGMVTMGFGPSSPIASLSVSSQTAEAASAWAAWSQKKKYPWMDQYENIYPEVFVIKASLIDINGKELMDPITKSVTKAYYDHKKPKVKATFKFVDAIKTKASDIFINALRVLKHKKAKDEEFYE